jgi:hypothetical protein
MDEDTVFGNEFPRLAIVTGQIRNPTVFVRNWPVDPTPDQRGGIQRNATATYDYDYEIEYGDDVGYDLDDSYDYDWFDYDFGGVYGYDSMDDAGAFDGYDYTIDDDAVVARHEQHNIETGREIAVVRLPARHNLPVLDASLIDEAFGWKFDVPEAVSGTHLRQSLLNHLTYLGENPQSWPGSEADAFRLFAHHVLMAVYGLEVPSYQNRQTQQQ